MSWPRWLAVVALVGAGAVIGCEVARQVYPARPGPWLAIVVWAVGAVSAVWIAEEGRR